MRAWFAARGLRLPSVLPPEPASKGASDDEERILGDVTGNGTASSWDLTVLWMYLTTIKRLGEVYDMDLVDINRDGLTDWTDLMLFGDFLYGSRENPHGIGGPIPDPVPPEPESAFSIELVFFQQSSLTEGQREIVRQAARRWESVITKDIPDYDFSDQPFDANLEYWWASWWNVGEDEAGTVAHPGYIYVDDVVDDLRVYVTTKATGLSSGGYFTQRLIYHGHNWRLYKNPILGGIILSEEQINEHGDAGLYTIALHQIGHALGFGVSWADSQVNLLRNPAGEADFTVTRDPFFPGFLAVDAFNIAGGSGYRGNKVPVENAHGPSNNRHWRESVFGDELMTSVFSVGAPLSAITIQSLADMGVAGYDVDVSQADKYHLPPSAKPTTRMNGHAYCKVLLPPPATR